MSGGRIEITQYTSGTLVPSGDIVDALDAGTIQMAYTGGTLYAGMIPECNLSPTMVPGTLWTRPEEVLSLYWHEGVGDLLREGYAEHGVYWLTILPTTGNTFWTVKPAYTVDDIKGMRIRFYGAHAKAMGFLGATPVYLPHQETYSALATGVIDGSGTTITHYLTSNFYEVCPYIYMPAWIDPSAMELLISMKVWNALPDDLKFIVQEAAELFAFESMLYERLEADKVMMSLDELGSTLITWSEEDVKKVRAAYWSQIPELAAISPNVAKGYEIIRNFAEARGYTP